MYSVYLSQIADKFLNKLDRHISDRITTRLKILEKEQVPSDAKFITRHNGEKVFRLKIGDYRGLNCQFVGAFHTQIFYNINIDSQ